MHTDSHFGAVGEHCRWNAISENEFLVVLLIDIRLIKKQVIENIDKQTGD